MSSTCRIPVLLVLVVALPHASWPLRPEDHLDTKAIQFRSISSRLATGFLPVEVRVPLLSDHVRLRVGVRSFCRSRSRDGGKRRKSCECDDALVRTSLLLVEELLARGLDRGWRPQHHAESWLDAVQSRGRQDDADDAEDARFAEERAEIAAVQDFVGKVKDQVWNSVRNANATMDIEPRNVSEALMVVLRNMTDAARCLANELRRDSEAMSYISPPCLLLGALINAVELSSSAVLGPCRQGKLPTIREAALRRSQAEEKAFRVFPDVEPLHPGSPAKPEPVLGVTCTLLGNGTLQIDYLLPVRQSKSTWHLYTAKPVPFMASGRRCAVFPYDIKFATNGTDVRDCTADSRWPMTALSDDVYLLPREFSLTHRERCLRALVHAASADEAMDACPVTCDDPDELMVVRQFNATSFAVLNPTSTVAVQCPGKADVLLRSIHSGRHEVTLPCECLARDANDDGEVFVHRGAACASGTGLRTALVVDSAWTDAGFEPVSLYTTRADKAVAPSGRLEKKFRFVTGVPLHRILAAEQDAASGRNSVPLLWVALSALALANLAYVALRECRAFRGLGLVLRSLRAACARRLPPSAAACLGSGKDDEGMALGENGELHGQD